MPKNNNIKEISFASMNSNPVLLPTNEGISLYLITGDTTLNETTEHLVISPSGAVVQGMEYKIAIPGNVTIGTFGIEVFGRVLTVSEAANPIVIICIYNGTTWDVDVHNSVASSGGGTTDYNALTNKPNVNDLSVSGDLDLGTNKALYSNVYAQLADLPSASSYHGMFAHVHATGSAYFAHDGAWVELAKTSDLGGGTAASTRERMDYDETNIASTVAYINLIGQSNGDGTQAISPTSLNITTPLTNVFHLTRQTAINGNVWTDESTWGWTGFTSAAGVNNLGTSGSGHKVNFTIEFAREWQTRIDNGEVLPDLYLTHMSHSSQGFGSSLNNNTRYNPTKNYATDRTNIWHGSLKLHKWALEDLLANNEAVVHLGLNNNQWEHDGYVVSEAAAYQSWMEGLLAEHDKIAGIKVPFTYFVPSTDGSDGRFLGLSTIVQSLENISGRPKIGLDPKLSSEYDITQIASTNYLGLYHDDVHYRRPVHEDMKDQFFTDGGHKGLIITSAGASGGGTPFSGDYNDLTNVPSSAFDAANYDLSTVVDNKIALVSSITKWEANKYESAATNLDLPGITYSTVDTPAAGWQSQYETDGKKYFRLDGRGNKYSFLNFSGLPTDTSFGSVIMRIKEGSRISIGVAFSMNDLGTATFQNSGKEFLGLAFYADSGNNNVTNATTCNTQAWSMASGVTLLQSSTVNSAALPVGAGTTGATDDIDLKFTCLPGISATQYNFSIDYRLIADTAWTNISTLTNVGVGAASNNVKGGGGMGIISGLGDIANDAMIDSMRFKSFEIISEE